MAQGDGDFLRRWSRRKLEVAGAASAAKPAADDLPPPLPSLDSVTFDSDFKAFMHAKVEQSVKRAALKKLFADPRFNIMDGLDIYIDDYSKDDPIPPAMLAQLEHSKSTLFGREPVKVEREAEVDHAGENVESLPKDASPLAEHPESLQADVEQQREKIEPRNAVAAQVGAPQPVEPEKNGATG